MATEHRTSGATCDDKNRRGCRNPSSARSSWLRLHAAGSLAWNLPHPSSTRSSPLRQQPSGGAGALPPPTPPTLRPTFRLATTCSPTPCAALARGPVANTAAESTARGSSLELTCQPPSASKVRMPFSTQGGPRRLASIGARKEVEYTVKGICASKGATEPWRERPTKPKWATPSVHTGRSASTPVPFGTCGPPHSIEESAEPISESRPSGRSALRSPL